MNNLREMFFNFFQTKQHLKLSSFSLVPKKGETSLLLINSGMAPMKDWFLGLSQPPSRRVVTCQKCVRTVDLQNVGKTDRHGTFFEMLGNFSFGDYFKHEAISFAWEFVTKVLKMPEDRLYVTVYEQDDEAQRIWETEQGVASDHIVKLGKGDNFWEIGKGPCGPCSEIYFDRGEQFGCGKATCGPGCDCDRFVEFWNLVFSQYCNDGSGNYENLAQKNIDTGMGLERLACIMQGVNNLFEVDSIKKILLEASRLAGVVYGQSKKVDVLIRIIVDHIRSSVFLISDGVLPSNEGRGYVLRRLIRRILTSAQVLKIKDGFLSRLAETVANENVNSYSELIEKLDFIQQVLQVEEEGFKKILINGQKLFDELVSELKSQNETKISAHKAFKLCDTFGMPFDLLLDLASQNGFEVDEAGFSVLLEEQKQRAKTDAASKTKGWSKDVNLSDIEFETNFVGYDQLECRACLKAILFEGKQVESATKGQDVYLIFDKTPFYVQGGGQVGDWGFVNTIDGLSVAEVTDCMRLKNGVFCHRAVVLFDGVDLHVGNEFCLEVESHHRLNVARNHTAAHILHQVLVNVLGKHVHQAGQLVNEEKLRFDFSHFKALSDAELTQIERDVNGVVCSCLEVNTELMDLDEAKKLGAKALFDEKYGESVRVVKVGDFSMELCGGTHVKNTGEIGVFKIIAETSVGAGVRRIEALTGSVALSCFSKLSKDWSLVCSQFKVEDAQAVIEKIEDLKTKLKMVEQDAEFLKFEISHSLFEKNLKIGYFGQLGLDFAGFEADLLSGKLLKTFGESLIQKNEKLVLLVCSNAEDKCVFLVGCSKLAVDLGLNAGKIAKQLAEMVGCKGGGKPSVAMAGVKSNYDFEVIKANFETVVKNNV